MDSPRRGFWGGGIFQIGFTGPEVIRTWALFFSLSFFRVFENTYSQFLPLINI